MPEPTVLTSDTMAEIDMESITNTNDLFIALALSRTGSHSKGYGPMSAKEISDRLLKIGIDISTRRIQGRHKDNQALFGTRAPEHGPTDMNKLRITDPKAIAQIKHLMRALRPLVHRMWRQPSFLYRRDDWAVVATWGQKRFTTRPATPDELKKDIEFRESAEDFS